MCTLYIKTVFNQQEEEGERRLGKDAAQTRFKLSNPTANSIKTTASTSAITRAVSN